ncbi:MAG TPA: ferritin family protein [bacterium]|jgi:rubrerythrin
MVDASTNPLEALQMALKREIAAEEFYLNAAKSAEETSSRKMFEFLAAEERKHQRIIQDEIDKNFLKEM